MNKKSGKVTMNDIALKLGVKESTVSKALRRSTDISSETAELIRKTAIEMGYDDRRMNHGTTRNAIIGVVFSELNSEYYFGMFDSFRREMTAAGNRVLTVITDFNDAEAIVDGIDYFIRMRVSGLYVLSEVDFDAEKVRALLIKRNTPSVFVTCMTDLDFCDSVNINHAIGVNLPLQRLISLGHERIAFIGDVYTGMREKAFRQTMETRFGGIREEFVAVSAERFAEGGYSAASKLLDLPHDERPTAILAAYDALAFGVYRAAAERGIKIPEELSVASIDDNQASACVNPGLTSVRVSSEEIGIRAAELISSRINGDESPFNTILLTPTLVERGSVAPPEEQKK